MNGRKVFLCLSILMALSSCAPQREMQLVQAEERSITVGGRGEIKASPDSAKIIFNIRTKDQDILVAKRNNRKITSNIRAAFKQFDIKNSDIKTEYLNVFPDPGGTPTIYTADTSIQATVYDLSQIEEILVNVLKTSREGIEKGYAEVTSHGVYFQISDLEYYKEQARSMALQNAKVKAVLMAEELEQEIGEVLSIQEVQSYPVFSPYGFTSALVANQQYLYLNPSENTVTFGHVTITTNVTVEFSLK